MRNSILLILALNCISYKAISQTTFVPASQIFSTKIAGATIGDISDTKGDCNQLKAIMSLNLECRNNNTAPYKALSRSNSSVSISFEDETDTGNYYSLTNISVLQSNIDVVYNETPIKIGDSINKLGIVRIVTASDGERFVSYSDSETGSSSLIFYLLDNTNTVKSIVYNSY